MLKKLLAIVALLGALVFLGLIAEFYMVSQKTGRLPDMPEELVRANSPVAFFSADSVYLKSSERFIYVPLEKIPKHVIEVFLASEDADFYSNYGISLKGMIRGLIINPLKGRGFQGGSTITQQLARNLFLSNERSVERKIREIVLAIWMNFKYTKDQILEAYFNSIPCGAGTQGVGTAARHFFDKEVWELTVPETATLVGSLPRPATRNPVSHPKEAEVFKKNRLVRLWDYGFYGTDTLRFQKDYLTPIVTKASSAITHIADHFVKMATEQLPPEVMSARNQSVGTTLNTLFQRELYAAIQDGLKPTCGQLGLKPFDPRMPDAEKAKYPQVAVVA
ncbi:hypothetical protein GYA13_00035, partial [Candidatus Kuenenbacteria bacterium]|nr:hypothetical protein [Candidatus Kuenenbacteria bacterium]